jgi:hypothetical protein
LAWSVYFSASPNGLLAACRPRAHFVEIKIPDGELSAAQKAVAAVVLLGGGRAAVVRTVEELLRCLDVWEIPRARRVAA